MKRSIGPTFNPTLGVYECVEVYPIERLRRAGVVARAVSSKNGPEEMGTRSLVDDGPRSISLPQRTHASMSASIHRQSA